MRVLAVVLFCISAALMVAATLVYVTHRREPEYHWVEEDDGWGVGV